MHGNLRAAPELTDITSPFREQTGSFIFELERDRETKRVEEQSEALQNFVEEIETSELSLALSELLLLEGSHPTEAGRELELRIIQKISEQNPAEAPLWIEKLRIANRSEACSRIAGTWASRHAQEAISWAESLTGEKRKAALSAIGEELAANHPMPALEVAIQLPAGEGRDYLITRAIASWAGTSPEEAGSWASQIPDDQLRQRSQAAIALQFANTDPFAAAEWVLGNTSPGTVQDNLVLGVVQRWVALEPVAASAWVGSFPDSDLREKALATISRISQLTLEL